MSYAPDAKPNDPERERMRAYVATLPPTPRRVPNVVYFVLASQTRRVKIGIAADPWYRLGNLQTGSPDKLVLLGGIVSDAARQLETELHATFAKWHSHGEWFDIFDGMLELIEELCAEDREAIWAMQPPMIDVPRVMRKSLPPEGRELPKGNSRAARMARYRLARGLDR